MESEAEGTHPSTWLRPSRPPALCPQGAPPLPRALHVPLGPPRPSGSLGHPTPPPPSSLDAALPPTSPPSPSPLVALLRRSAQARWRPPATHFSGPHAATASVPSQLSSDTRTTASRRHSLFLLPLLCARPSLRPPRFARRCGASHGTTSVRTVVFRGGRHPRAPPPAATTSARRRARPNPGASSLSTPASGRHTARAPSTRGHGHATTTRGAAVSTACDSRAASGPRACIATLRSNARTPWYAPTPPSRPAAASPSRPAQAAVAVSLALPVALPVAKLVILLISLLLYLLGTRSPHLPLIVACSSPRRSQSARRRARERTRRGWRRRARIDRPRQAAQPFAGPACIGPCKRPPRALDVIPRARGAEGGASELRGRPRAVGPSLIGRPGHCRARARRAHSAHCVPRGHGLGR